MLGLLTGISLGNQRASAPALIDGYAIGSTGAVGSIWEGFTLRDADDFLGSTPDLIKPGNSRGKYPPTRGAFDFVGARGSQASTNFYGDPNYTGYNDSNRGAALGWDSITQANSVIRLKARQMTAPEQAHVNATGGSVTGGVRQLMAAGISTIFRCGFYVGSSHDIIVDTLCRHKAKASAPRGAHPTVPWVDCGAQARANAVGGNEIDLNEGTSQAAYLEHNVWPGSGGSATATNYAGPVDKFDGLYHRWSCRFSAATSNFKLYVDDMLGSGPQLVATAAVNPNSKGHPQFLNFTVLSLITGFKGESFVLADWATLDYYVDVDNWRIWSSTAAPHYVPLASQADVNCAYAGSWSVVLPSKLALWGDAGVTEIIEQVGLEDQSPGTPNTGWDTLPTGVTWTEGTRTLAGNWASDATGAGRAHYRVTAYKTTGATCQPLHFCVNRGPKLPASITVPTTGTLDLYAAIDCGILTSNSAGTKAKTIVVNSGMPAGCSYSDSTGLITASGAASTSVTLNISCTDSAGNVATGNIDMLVADLAAETTALVARFTTPPTSARKVLINNFVLALKTGAISGANIWNKLDALYVFAAADAQAAARNWIGNTFNATLVQPTTPVTFTADRGFTTNGTDNYVETGFNPSTAVSAKFVLNSASFGVRSLTSAQQTNLTAGAFITAAGSTTIQARSTTDTMSWRVNQANFDSVASTDGSGLFAVNRSGAGATQAYKAGSSIGSGTQATAALVNDTFKCGRPTVTGFSARQFASLFFGQSLTANEMLDFNNAERTYMTGVGVP